ncbi:MAG TPA: ankyrin repeat domain-containing protein [Phytomonospora sp.]
MDALYHLHRAAESGSPADVARLAREVGDADTLADGRSALWIAVWARRDDNARALVEAGADPWLPMMGGWSPARLSLAGPTPELFGEAREALSADEEAAVAAAPGLIAALDAIDDDGWSVCCVGGIDTDEALRRLAAAELPGMPDYDSEEWDDLDLDILGFTDVPGGLVVAQPWAYGANAPVVTALLSAGTVAYAMYANPKSGDQGSAYRDGAMVGGDLNPAGWPEADDSPAEILRTYLYQYASPAYCCAYAGVHPPDSGAFLEPHRWARLPERDYWAVPSAAAIP